MDTLIITLAKGSIKALHIQKKVIRLITGIKNMIPADRYLRKF
jgi:hypothetical protein